MHLAYEFRRPSIALDTEGSRALRDLLALNTDEVTAFSNDTCVAYVSRVLQDISELLAMPIGETVRTRLQQIHPLSARLAGGMEGDALSERFLDRVRPCAPFLLS